MDHVTSWTRKRTDFGLRDVELLQLSASIARNPGMTTWSARSRPDSRDRTNSRPSASAAATRREEAQHRRGTHNTTGCAAPPGIVMVGCRAMAVTARCGRLPGGARPNNTQVRDAWAEGDDSQVEQGHGPGSSQAESRRSGAKNQGADRDAQTAPIARTRLRSAAAGYARRPQRAGRPPLARPDEGAAISRLATFAQQSAADPTTPRNSIGRHLEVAADYRSEIASSRTRGRVGLREPGGARRPRRRSDCAAALPARASSADHLQHVLTAGTRRQVDERQHRTERRPEFEALGAIRR